MARSAQTPGGKFVSPARSLEELEPSPTETTTLLQETAQPSKLGDDLKWDGLADFEHLPWWRRPSVFWLLGPYSLFTLAFGGIIVPKLNLIVDLICKQYFADMQTTNPDMQYAPIVMGGENPQCNGSEVQKRVSLFMLVMTSIVGVLSAFTAPKLGHLSDRHGRRRLMAVASAGGIMSEVITILAAKFPNSVDYRWLVLGSVFDGLAGSFTLGSILSQSYTSDCTPPSKRASAIGYIHACLFTGIALGPLLAGFFVKWTGSLLSIFYVVLGCHLTFALFVAFVVPESLSQRRQLVAREKHRKETELLQRQEGGWVSNLRSSNPFAPLHILWPRHEGTSNRLRINLVILAAMDTIIMGSMMAAGAVVMLYSKHVFGWENFELSIFVSSLSSMRVFVLMGIFPVVNYFVRIRPAARRHRESGVPMHEKNSGADGLDIWVLRVALVSDLVGSIGYSLSRTEPMFFASGLMTAVGGLGSATVQATVTKHVPPSRTGQVLGAVGMLNALSRVIGPILFNGLYSLTVDQFPQAAFVLLASFFGLALLCSFVLKPHVYWEEGADEETEPLASNGHVSGRQPDAGVLAQDDELFIR